MKDYSGLQNGSDIRGVALSGVEGQEVNLTLDAVGDIARGFGAWLAEHTGRQEGLRVGVGRDCRLSGPDIARTFCQALEAGGVTVYDCGMASTPAMFMTTVTPGFEFDAAVMITASHLPSNRNGLKFFTARGGLEKADIKDILRRAATGESLPVAVGSVESCDFIPVYARQLVDTVRKQVNASDFEHPLKGFHIVVDAGNGAGGFYADQVLLPLGADISGSQFLEPDGNFPNHMPNPEDTEAMKSIIGAVRAQRADLGIIFDTDVDRGGAVDDQGREINRNRLIAMIAAILLEESPGCGIVTDSITSSGLTDFIVAKGGVHHRFKRGYKNVINEATRLNAEGGNYLAAIETSGHGALEENYFLDDGAYLVTKLIIKMARMAEQGQKLSELIQDLKEPVESMEFRLDIREEFFTAYGMEILADLADHAQLQPGWMPAEENYEGVRVAFPEGGGNGWFLLRMSLHDPLMPLNIESDSPGGCRIIAEKLAAFLAPFEKLDQSKLKAFLQ